MTITTTPLDRLFISKLNVRKTGADKEIADLAGNIAAVGLFQNLVVIERTRKTGSR